MRKITILDWKCERLHAKGYPTDAYYVKLANKLLEYIRFSSLGKDLDEFEQARLAKTIALYLEDVISGVGLWRAFVDKHKELYGKYLPFFEVDEEDYCLDEINREDVQFLIWMCRMRFREEAFFNPENWAIEELASKLYGVLDAEFEEAPINSGLKEYLFKPQIFDDLMLVKDWCIWMLDRSYLTVQDQSVFNYLEQLEEELKSIYGSGNDGTVTYVAYSIASISMKVGPLALTAPGWLSQLLKVQGLNMESQLVADLEGLPINLYILKKFDDENIYLEGLDEKMYVVCRNSFSGLSEEVLQIGKGVLVPLVRYNQTWHVVGGASWGDFAEEFKEIRKDTKGKKASARLLFDKILAANAGSPLLYFKDYEELMGWLGKHIGFSSDFEPSVDLESGENLIVWTDPASDLKIVSGAAACVKDERNPYYNSQKAGEEALNILADSQQVPSEMLHYLLEHHLLPDARINSTKGEEYGKKLIQENLDFVARFTRGDRY